MAMTIDEVTLAIRAAADPEAIDASIANVVQPIYNWADHEITRVAPSAPDSVRDMALVLLVGYVYDRPAASRGSGYANAFENSGASSVMRGYILRNISTIESGPIEAAAAAAAAAPAGQFLTRAQIQDLINSGIDAAINAHAARGEAHHGAVLSPVAIAQLIANHAGDANAHHVPPAGGGGGGALAAITVAEPMQAYDALNDPVTVDIVAGKVYYYVRTNAYRMYFLCRTTIDSWAFVQPYGLVRIGSGSDGRIVIALDPWIYLGAGSHP